ncbi:Fur family transcriptional regulator [Duganella guangzhouensis]|nr:transcriptional repressor [Duganella guangzhouensis]
MLTLSPEVRDDAVTLQVQAWLRKTSLRMTVARMAVVQVLACAGAPVDAASVQRALLANGGDASLATVYRILKELEQHALVEREWHHTALGTHSCYQIRSGPERKRNCYFECDVCGRRRKVAEPALANQLVAAAGHEGYSPLQELIVISRCSACIK